MTPEERQVITGIFERLQAAQNHPRDPEAERLIADLVAQQPYAPYAMAQSIYVHEQALANLGQRAADLERQLHEAQEKPQSGGFLSGLFGGPTPGQPGPDPQTSPQAPPRGPSSGGARATPLWGRNLPSRVIRPPSKAIRPLNRAIQAVGLSPGRGGAQPRAGGFLQGAMSTAAGVAGGMVLANVLSSAFSHAGTGLGSSLGGTGLGTGLGGAGLGTAGALGSGVGALGFGRSDAGRQDNVATGTTDQGLQNVSHDTGSGGDAGHELVQGADPSGLDDGRDPSEDDQGWDTASGSDDDGSFDDGSLDDDFGLTDV